MKRDRNLLSEITHLIYSASLYPEQWGSAVSRINSSLMANKSILFTPFVGPQHGGVAFPVGFSQESLEVWANQFIDKDEVGKKMMQKKLFFSGSACIDSDLFPTKKEYQAFLDSPIYRGYCIPYNLHHNCVGVVFEGSPDLPPTVFSAWRGVEQPAFTQDDKKWMELLIAHISRSMGIMMRLDTARLQTATFQASLDRMKFGVMLLSEELQAIYVNSAAQKILDRDDGIRLNEDLIPESREADTYVQSQLHEHFDKTRAKSGTQRLQQSHTLATWLAGCKNMPKNEQRHFLHGATVLRKADKSSSGGGSNRRKRYTLQCAPLPVSDLLNVNNARAHYAVFICDPQSVQLPCIERLATTYGLTETEASISLAFVEQGNYKGVAQQLGTSENTVRWHVKNIYPKLGIHKLADLVRMVMALAESAVLVNSCLNWSALLEQSLFLGFPGIG